jgi:hypothetical protein
MAALIKVHMALLRSVWVAAAKDLMVNLTTREITADLAHKSGAVETRDLTDNPVIRVTVHLMAHRVRMVSLVIKAGVAETRGNLKTRAGVQLKAIMDQA